MAFASCSKNEESQVESLGAASEPAKISARTNGPDFESGPGLKDLPRVSLAERGEVFRGLLLETDDEDMDLVMEAVERLDSDDEKLDLLYLLASDLEGRDEMVRLPSLFWVAVHPSTDQGLKNTVLADLRRELDLSYMPDLTTLAEKLEEHLGENGALQ